MISYSSSYHLTTSQKVQNTIGKFKQFVEDLYGDQLNKIILFGSQAIEEARSDSDIDILIVTDKNLSKKEREKLINLISDISINDDILINFIEILTQRFQSENSPLLLNIRRQGIVL